jgi:hypothetical protein
LPLPPSLQQEVVLPGYVAFGTAEDHNVEFSFGMAPPRAGGPQGVGIFALRGFLDTDGRVRVASSGSYEWDKLPPLRFEDTVAPMPDAPEIAVVAREYEGSALAARYIIQLHHKIRALVAACGVWYPFSGLLPPDIPAAIL